MQSRIKRIFYLSIFSVIITSIFFVNCSRNGFDSAGKGSNGILKEVSYVTPITEFFLIPQNLSSYNEIPSNFINSVFVSSGTTYIATADAGISISSDNGDHWFSKTTANGLGSNNVYGLTVSEKTIYAATSNGLSISTDNGVHWVNKTTADGLGNNFITSVYATGNTMYATTIDSGLSISTDNGVHWINKTTTDGLGSNFVLGVFSYGNNIYVATSMGLSVNAH